MLWCLNSYSLFYVRNNNFSQNKNGARHMIAKMSLQEKALISVIN